jgi:hypothetical protein
MAIAFHATTAPPTSANAAQAMRHCSAASSAAGPERATPMLVPELIMAFALSCSSSLRDAATASPMGGEARPLLLPATSTPSASTKPVGAPATIAMPTTATDPAASAIRRGPEREVSTSAPSTARQ